MEEVIATISKGNEVFIENTTAAIQVAVDHKGLQSWNGVFFQPKGSLVPVGAGYLFKTNDGRGGKIGVRYNAIVSLVDRNVEFYGMAEFDEPQISN